MKNKTKQQEKNNQLERDQNMLSFSLIVANSVCLGPKLVALGSFFKIR